MITFIYTNNKGNQSLYAAEPLTENLYSDILQQDRGLLEQISKGEIEDFKSNSIFAETAATMLVSHGRDKNTNAEIKKNEDSLIMLVISKTPISTQEETPVSKTTENIKQIIRKSLPSSKIRLFKKEKMQFSV